jgi:hypothetical protein
MTIVRADVRGAQDPYARRRANHGQSTDGSPRCLPPALGKGGIGAVGGMSRCGPSGYGVRWAGTLTGSTLATVLVRAHYPWALPR